MSEDLRAAARRLIAEQRWAALATTGSDGTPLASMVAYAVEPATGDLVLHLSRLARHTRNLLERDAVGLVISEPDGGAGDPQTLARIGLTGRIAPVTPDAPDYPGLRALYVGRFPASAPRFEFGDFALFRFEPARARYVGGFGRARSFDAAGLGHGDRC